MRLDAVLGPRRVVPSELEMIAVEYAEKGLPLPAYSTAIVNA